jgi:hypothetical protein
MVACLGVAIQWYLHLKESSLRELIASTGKQVKEDGEETQAWSRTTQQIVKHIA